MFNKREKELKMPVDGSTEILDKNISSFASEDEEREYIYSEIKRLKKEKNAVILAHYYQRPEIQDIADYRGDSLGLSQKAASTSARVIVFAGVHFMAETAKILSPGKKVVVPDKEAGCSLSDSCPPEEFRKFVNEHPQHAVVTYVNCSAEIKAMSDIICTSSNAVKIIQSIPEDKPVIFAPDKNLGRYLARQSGRDMLLWDGVCQVHEVFSVEKLKELKSKHPGAELLVHPECDDLVQAFADFIGSTSKMLNYSRESSAKEFIVNTEPGLLYQMEKESPEKKFIPAPPVFETSCACSECAFMKLNTLEKLHACLKDEEPEVDVPLGIREKAYLPIQKMMEISAGTGK